MRRFSIIVVLMMAGATCLAQKPLKSLPQNTVEAFRPEMFSGQVLSQDMVESLISKHYAQGSTSPSFMKSFWDVYSDRDDNLTYSTAKEKDVYSSLQFGERVRIARIKGDFALVYSCNDPDIAYPYLPSDPEWKGWVPLSHLLLWDKGLSNEKGQRIKAVISSSVSSNSASSRNGKLYRTPDSPKSFVNLPSSPEVFFYVIKKENGMYLLSKEYDTDGYSESLYGWVTAQSVLLWDNNVCAEPTWSITKVNAFSSSGVSCVLNSVSAERVGNITFTKRDLPFYQTDFYRLPENSWRYPLLSINSKLLLLAIPENDPCLDSAANATASDSDLDNVNIVFVIDGSRSYEQYYPLIVENLEGLKSRFTHNDIRAAAFIYRDVRNEDFRVEYCPLLDIRSRVLLDFIDQGGEYGFRDNPSEPAMFDGILQALDEVDFRPSETNLMIVIGGRGDCADAVGVNTVELADRLDGANISLYGIQVQNNPAASANRLFNYQISDLIYSKLKARAGKIGVASDAVIQSVEDDGSLNHICFALNDIGNRYLDDHVYPGEGLMDEDVFSASLNRIIDNQILDIDTQKRSMGTGSNGLSQLFTQAYTMEQDMAGRSFFDYVVLYEESEFARIMGTFEYLYNQYLTSSYNVRDYYVFLSRLLSFIPETSTVKAENRGDLEAFRLFEGRDCFLNEYPGVRLKDISDKKYTPEQYKSFLSDFALKYEKLMEIQMAPYKFSSIINGKKYYWIPIEYLP